MDAQQDRQFAALLAFFDRYGSEVLGHESRALDDATIADIRRFAAGELHPEHWDGFFERMANQPEWLKVLAEELKSGGISAATS